VPATINRNLDLLFVIDDSGSMLAKQESFAASFPGYLDALSAIEGGLPDLHVGVVTTDMGTRASNNTSAPPIGTVGQGGCANAGKDGRDYMLVGLILWLVLGVGVALRDYAIHSNKKDE
jgi:hypothetical protein